MRNVALFLAGPPPSAALIGQRFHAADFRIAVDGGINAFLELEFAPDLLIGDLDSATRSDGTWATVEEVDQETTDLEKAIRWLAGPAAPCAPLAELDLTLLGAIGGRMDHFLTNLLVLSRLPDTTLVSLISDRERIVRVTPGQALDTSTLPGDIVSVLPLTACVVSSLGLKWELESEALSPAGLISQSNAATGTSIKLRVHEGQAWVVLPA